MGDQDHALVAAIPNDVGPSGDTERRFPEGERLSRVPKYSKAPNARRMLSIMDLRDNQGDCVNRFLHVLATTGRVIDARNTIGVTENVLYHFRDENDEFRALWKDAQDLYTASLEDEVQRRAVEGIQKTIFYKGEVIGIERQYDSMLLIALLKRRSVEWQRALAAPGTNVDVNVQTLQNAPGAPGAPALDQAGLIRRMAALSPQERDVARRLFGLDHDALPPGPTGDTTTDPVLVQASDQDSPRDE